jgi:hypothetical protein
MRKWFSGLTGTGVRACIMIGLAGFAPGAWAYLDPSTGSMILSAIVGIFATLTLAIKTYWYKLKAFFTGRKGGDSAPGDEHRPASGTPGDRSD